MDKRFYVILGAQHFYMDFTCTTGALWCSPPLPAIMAEWLMDQLHTHFFKRTGFKSDQTTSAMQSGKDRNRRIETEIEAFILHILQDVDQRMGLKWRHLYERSRMHLSASAKNDKNHGSDQCLNQNMTVETQVVARLIQQAVVGRILTEEQLLRYLRNVVSERYDGLHIEQLSSDLYLNALALAGRLSDVKDSTALNARVNHTNDPIRIRPGIGLVKKAHGDVFECRRCGAVFDTPYLHDCVHCGDVDVYCPICASLGLIRGCTLIVEEPMDQGNDIRQPSLTITERLPLTSPASSTTEFTERLTLSFRPSWLYRLTPWQQKAAQALLEIIDDKSVGSVSLLWAVTGAGKTEMLYPLLERLVTEKKRVLWATPRRDVVLELYPRLKEALPYMDCVALYGGSDAFAETGDVTLATTHQALIFQNYFDIILVDEADAYPYTVETYLKRGIQRALRANGRMIIVTATPGIEAIRDVMDSDGRMILVPRRYHGQPLPEPRFMPFKERGKKGDLSLTDLRVTVEPIQEKLKQGRKLFIFVPRVADVEAVVQFLKESLPTDQDVIAGTHASDPDRDVKVSSFRQGTVKIMVTTTILERGITIAESDVYVFWADAPLFDAPSLVQIAGRAGRKAHDPTGEVVFWGYMYHSAIRSAIEHIRWMNAWAITMPEGKKLSARDMLQSYPLLEHVHPYAFKDVTQTSKPLKKSIQQHIERFFPGILDHIKHHFILEENKCLLCERMYDVDNEHPLGALLCADCRAHVLPLTEPLCSHCGRSRNDPRLHTLKSMPSVHEGPQERLVLNIEHDMAVDHLDICHDCRHTWFSEREIGNVPSSTPELHLQWHRSAVVFTAPMKAALHRYKYERALEFFPLFSILLRLAYLRYMKELSLDGITFVPMDQEKEMRRGFNQAAALARDLGTYTGLPVFDLLQRAKNDDVVQAALSRRERLKHVQNLYHYHPTGMYDVQSKNKTISTLLLIDDVYTTGATLHACAHALRKGGHETIYGLTVFRA